MLNIELIKRFKDPENLWEVISILFDIRAGYNLFDEDEQLKHHALTVAIKKLREELVNED